MARAGIVLLSLCLVVVTAFAGALALRACALRLPLVSDWLGQSCPSAAQLAAADRLADLVLQRDALIADIRAAERQLAQRQCQAVYETPEMPPELPADSPPEAPQIDGEAWRERDLGLLEGCWQLDSDYRVRNSQTGAMTEYTEWQMCFDDAGRGAVDMQATNGTSCQGDIAGRFDAAGQLVLEESENLPCSDRTAILRRVITCSLAQDGAADCASHQPSADLTAQVRLRRSAGVP